MLPLKTYINKPHIILEALRYRIFNIYRIFEPYMSDKSFLEFIFPQFLGKKLNLDKPKTFNEKLQWLKLYNRKSLYTLLVDKHSVKGYIASIIGDNYVIPTIGIYNNFDEIDFDKLPNQFVLKTTHGGGGNGVVICRAKDNFDKKKAKKIISKNLKEDIYRFYKEWPYKDVPRKIIAEPYLTDLNGELKDYKFFCFNGIPKFLKVDFDRFIEHHANYYMLNWERLPFGESICPPDPTHQIEKPKNLATMIHIAQELSKNLPFVRVDLYNLDGKILFGELTFFPASGFGKFEPYNWDEKIGNLLDLPIK